MRPKFDADVNFDLGPNVDTYHSLTSTQTTDVDIKKRKVVANESRFLVDWSSVPFGTGFTPGHVQRLAPPDPNPERFVAIRCVAAKRTHNTQLADATPPFGKSPQLN